MMHKKSRGVSFDGVFCNAISAIAGQALVVGGLTLFCMSGAVATGAITGVHVEDVTDEVSSIDGYGDGWRTYRYYAEFDDPSGQLMTVGLVTPSSGPMNLQATGGEIHRASPPFGSRFAPEAELLSFFPDLAYDTFFTFGVTSWTADSSPFFVTPDYGLTFTDTAITSDADNGALVNVYLGDPNIGWAGQYDNNRVLFLQVTMKPGAASSFDPVQPMAGTIGLAGIDGEPLFFELPAVPAPGAIALLSIAGIICLRRRRA